MPARRDDTSAFDCSHYFSLPGWSVGFRASRDRICRIVRANIRAEIQATGSRVDLRAVVRTAMRTLALARKQFLSRKTGVDATPPCAAAPLEYFRSIARSALRAAETELAATEALTSGGVVGAAQQREQDKRATQALREPLRRAAREWLRHDRQAFGQSLRTYLWCNVVSPGLDPRASERTDLRLLAFAIGLDGATLLREELGELLHAVRDVCRARRVAWSGASDDLAALELLRSSLEVLHPLDWLEIAPCLPPVRWQPRQPATRPAARVVLVMSGSDDVLEGSLVNSTRNSMGIRVAVTEELRRELIPGRQVSCGGSLEELATGLGRRAYVAQYDPERRLLGLVFIPQGLDAAQ